MRNIFFNKFHKRIQKKFVEHIDNKFIIKCTNFFKHEIAKRFSKGCTIKFINIFMKYSKNTLHNIRVKIRYVIHKNIPREFAKEYNMNWNKIKSTTKFHNQILMLNSCQNWNHILENKPQEYFKTIYKRIRKIFHERFRMISFQSFAKQTTNRCRKHILYLIKSTRELAKGFTVNNIEKKVDPKSYNNFTI